MSPASTWCATSEGGWNLASLLERNAQIPAAPTAKPPSERRPAFPYLEASNARVNFKIGETKKSYALRDADVALWQDSENSWGARITAEPVRTDFNLTDTGLLQINATWQRASSLRVTPVRIAVRWQNGQLGQITKLLTENDRGWRGGVSMTAQISGTPEALQIESRTGIEDFHRYDIVDSENVRLTTTCSGQYNTVTGRLSDLLCESPAGGGDSPPRRGVRTADRRAELRFDARGRQFAAGIRGAVVAPGKKEYSERSHSQWIVEWGVPRDSSRFGISFAKCTDTMERYGAGNRRSIIVECE